MVDPAPPADLVHLADRLVAAARRAGADAADALVTRETSVEANCRLGARDSVERAESAEVGLRVFLGRRQGLVSSTGLAADPERLAERAVAIARMAPEDPHCGLAPEAMLARLDDRAIARLELDDGREASADELFALALRAEAAGLEVSGITNSDGARASSARSAVALATSTGFAGGFTTSRHGLSVTLYAERDGAKETDYDYAVRRFAAHLPSPEELGIKAAMRALRRLGSRKIASGAMPVVFDPRTARSIVSSLASAVSGSAVARGTSFLKGMLGATILPEGVDVIDDASLPRGLASSPFDGEGVARRMLRIIDQGRLAHFLLDSATARKLGRESTGHAQRSPSGPPSPGHSNLYLAPGEISAEALMADIPHGLYVTDLLGRGVNLVTGDVSRGIAGLLIENGRLAHAVSEVTIAGNLLDMLRTLVPASDLGFEGSVNAPTLRVERMMVAGA